jgi:hypothetical protein
MLKKIRSLFSWKLSLLSFGFVVGIVLLIAGEIQQKYVRNTIEKSVEQQLRTEAANILKSIDYRNQWSLEGYHNEAIDFAMPSAYYYVIDRNGVIGDIQQGKQLMLQDVTPPEKEISNSIKSIHTPYNEEIRLLGKYIEGGWVVVGGRTQDIHSRDDLKSFDDDLKKELKKFGTTLIQAKKITTRQLDSDFDFVLVDSHGNFVNGYGGIPVKAGIDSDDRHDPKIRRISVPIIGKDGADSGASLVLAKDMSVELSTIGELEKTNKLFASIIALSTFALGLIFLLPTIFRKHTQVSIDDALKTGEGKHIEFKSTFQCSFGSPEKVNDKRLIILKAIAGFLNGDGGTLFIGIMEQPPDPPFVRGLPEDLELVQNNTDSMRRTLISLIADKIGKQFSDFISDRLEERNGKLCWIITVTRSPEPAFVKWKVDSETKEHKHFYVREGPRTADLDLENTWRYIKNRWRI